MYKGTYVGATVRSICSSRLPGRRVSRPGAGGRFWLLALGLAGSHLFLGWAVHASSGIVPLGVCFFHVDWFGASRMTLGILCLSLSGGRGLTDLVYCTWPRYVPMYAGARCEVNPSVCDETNSRPFAG